MTGAPARRRFNPWPWVAPVAILLTAIPNAVMMVVAHRVNPSAVEAHPYLSSQHVDEDKARRAAFASGGWRLATAATGLHLVCTLQAPAGAAAPTDALLALYRPDDPALDRSVPWPDPGAPLAIDLARPGRWRLRLELRSGAGALATSAVVEAHAPLAAP